MKIVADANIPFLEGVLIVAQSYMVWVRNYYGKADMTFAHRGGYYVATTECFGAGVMY